MRIATISLLALAFASGCGNKGDGGTGGGGGGGGTAGGAGGGMTPPVGQGEFCQKLAEAQCNREVRCGTVDSANLGLCKAQVNASCSSALGMVDAGVLSYAASNAGKCLSDYEAYPCTRTGIPAVASCASVLEGAGTSGKPCASGSVAVGGLIINNGLAGTCAQGYCTATGLACGACVAYQTVGQTCDGQRILSATQRCDPDTTFCPVDAGSSPRLCQTFKPKDAPCTSAGILNINDAECADLCVERGDGGFRCGYNAPGEACRNAAACGPDAYCKDLFVNCARILCTTVRAGVCTPRIALGSTCINEERDDGCRDGGTCLEGKCVPAPFYSQPVGKECDSITQCVEGAFCKDLEGTPPDAGGSQGVCATRLAAGSSCGTVVSNDDPCVSSAACNGPNCVPYNSAGGSCSTSGSATQQCKHFLDCYRPDAGLDGTCRLPADAGQACGSAGVTCKGESYPNAFCQVFAGAAPTCATTPLADGMPCAQADNCASRRCLNPDAGSLNRTCQPSCF
ncbi:MAG: hypothetical protein IPJ65_34980 [Archangiaceae bacterium]|nr:hypothetical protein [Archangiaceae bacterium]